MLARVYYQNPRQPCRSVDAMDIPSMIMGASIVSIGWIAFWPWAQLKRLRELESNAEAPDPGASA